VHGRLNMEVLAAASSIAGVLSLAGQCITGLQHLRVVYDEISGASTTISTFLDDVDSLLRSLHDVQTLLEQVPLTSASKLPIIQTSSLHRLLEECDSSIGGWISTARSLPTAGAKSGKAWYCRFRLAMNKDPIAEMRAGMQRRRTEVVLGLALFGRYVRSV